MIIATVLTALHLSGCGDETKQRAERLEKRKATTAERLAEGAVVQSVTKISDDETVKVIRVPQASYGMLEEKTCVVYTHERFRVAQLSCDTAGEFVDVAEPE